MDNVMDDKDDPPLASERNLLLYRLSTFLNSISLNSLNWKHKTLVAMLVTCVFLFLARAVGGEATVAPTPSPPPALSRRYVETVLMPTVTSLPTTAPMATRTPAPTATIGPYGDENGNPAPAPMLYPWASPEWRDYASHILAGERDGQMDRRTIACSLVRDVLRGYGPWDLRKRWYGWREPSWADRLEIWHVVFQTPGHCDGIPWCRYVGSGKDYELWSRRGMVDGMDTTWYGNTVCVHLW